MQVDEGGRSCRWTEMCGDAGDRLEVSAVAVREEDVPSAQSLGELLTGQHLEPEQEQASARLLHLALGSAGGSGAGSA